MIPSFSFKKYLKSNRNVVFRTAFFFVALNMPGFAQQPHNPEPAIEKVNFRSQSAALSEQDVIESALENSRKLQSLNTSVEIANYRLKSSGWLRNPELRLSEVSTKYYTDARDELRVGLRFRFPQLGELGEEKQQARVRLWDKKVNKIRYRYALIGRVRRSYAKVLMYDQQAELAQKRIALENKRIAIVEKMVDLGRRSIVYFTKAKMWHAESQNDYARAIQRQGLARRTLSKRAGISEDTPLIQTELPEVTLDVERLVEIAFENRPEMELVQQRIELAVRQNRYEFYKVFPWPTFIDVSYHKEEDRQDWAEIRIGIDLPLFNWNRGNIKATNLAARKKEDEFDAIRESIEDEVRTVYEIYRDILLDWNNFKTNADNLISNAQNVIEQAKEHDTLMPDEVVEMELTILDTKKLLGQKRRDLSYALIELYDVISIENHSLLVQQ